MKHTQASSCALLALVACIALQNSHAAGRINFVAGNVSVTTLDGQLRIPGKGDRIETGDAIHTGRDGEVHVHMDDNGLIALRANTFLRIEAYQADGGAQDSAVFRLLRGSLRSITGWIGKNNAQRYAVRTPTATIGIRGTDHETLVLEDGEKAGTYEKVNSGETELATPLGKVSVASGQAAFAPKGTLLPPSRLAVIPAMFTPTDNESRIDADKKLLEATRDENLRNKQQDNVRKGVGNDGKPRIGDPQDARRALAAFEDMLRAFEAGNVALIRARLDPSMIGFQQLLDGIALDTNECKQMRVAMLNTQVQAGPEMAVIQTSWAKRCLMLPAFTPRLTAGRSTILLHLGPSGWTFAAITGGNMFERPAPVVAPPVTPPVVNPPVVTPPVVVTPPPVVTPPVVTPPVVTPPVVEPPIVTPPVVTPPVVTPPVVEPPVVTPPVVTPPVVTPPVVTPPVVTPPVVTRTLARLSVGVGAGTSYGRAAALPGSSMLPFSISLTDPDSAGVGAVMVTVTTSSGDSQTLMLPATGSGAFSVMGLNFSQAATTRLNPVCGTSRPSNAGSLEICPGGSVTVSFTDTTTPSGSPQTVSATAVVN